jgi:hypothetical protein
MDNQNYIIMKKVLDFIKKIYTIVKNWVVANGIEGVLGLIVGLFLWAFGYKVYAGFAFGVFATRNWDLVKGLFKK